MKITITFETTERSTKFLKELAGFIDNSEILSELAKDEGFEVKCAVARNPNTSPETLSELAKSRFVKPSFEEYDYWNVKYAVAKHPNTPAETLSELAKDANLFVSIAARENPNFKK